MTPQVLEGVTIRPRKTEDIRDLVRLFTECFGPTTLKQVREYLRKDPAKTDAFVIEVGGHVVSHIDVRYKEIHFEEGAFIRTGGIASVATLPGHRRKGYARLLLERASEAIRARGVSTAALFTGIQSQGHSIYEKLGYFDVSTSYLTVSTKDLRGFLESELKRRNKHLALVPAIRRALNDWKRNIEFRISRSASLYVRCEGKRLVLKDSRPERVHVRVVCDRVSFLRLWLGVRSYEDALKSGARVEAQDPEDAEMVKRMLTWGWDRLA